eukprot:5491745-Prymnesium_polylepis.1
MMQPCSRDYVLHPSPQQPPQPQPPSQPLPPYVRCVSVLPYVGGCTAACASDTSAASRQASAPAQHALLDMGTPPPHLLALLAAQGSGDKGGRE